MRVKKGKAVFEVGTYIDFLLSLVVIFQLTLRIMVTARVLTSGRQNSGNQSRCVLHTHSFPKALASSPIKILPRAPEDKSEVSAPILIQQAVDAEGE